MRKKTAIIVASSIVCVAILALAVPLPFKPSAWSYYKEKQIEAQLDKSADPVYIETVAENYQGKLFQTTFTVYKNWVDAYHVGSYYQFSGTSKIGYDSEGPSKEELAFFQAIIDGKQCAKTEQSVSYCSIAKTDAANQREFAAVWRGQTALVTEMTTMYHRDGTSADGHHNYKRKDQKDIDAVLRIMTEVKPVGLETAKTKYFKPVY